MKNYIGVKIVKAEPKEKNGVPGYAVKYPDGYVSWSPKETFEKQLCLNRYQERVRNGEIPSWIDPEKFKILERTVAEIAGDWKEAEDE